jgi:hypothetical protein
MKIAVVAKSREQKRGVSRTNEAIARQALTSLDCAVCGPNADV